MKNKFSVPFEFLYETQHLQDINWSHG